MKSTAQRPALPKEVEALRTSLDKRLSALEKALADPKQHGSLESLILDLARIATQEADATARQAVIAAQKAGQQSAAAARAEANAALEAEKVESAALRQVIEGAKQALKQAEAALKEERRSAEAANRDVAGARRELAVLQESLEHEQSTRASQQRELDNALAALEGERGVAAEVVRGSSELEQSLDALRGELAASRSDHEAARRELDDVRAELDSIRGERDAMRAELDSVRSERDAIRGDRDSMQRDLDGTRRELDGIRQESEVRSHTLSQSQAEQEQAINAAHDAARSAEARLEEANRDREAAQNDMVELQRQLEAAEQAIRDAEAVSRELQAAHEARDAAEVEAARHAERSVDREPEIVVDLTSITKEEERQLEIDRRTRALEVALRDAESRAESAELELDLHRQSVAGSPVESAATPVAAPEPSANEATEANEGNEGQEQFRGPARGARRVTFKADITVQVDGTPGKLVDLSLTGAQVLAPAAINPNRLVTVTLPMDDNPISCKAKVMWSRLEPRSGQLWYRAGVMFTSVDQPALEAFLHANQP